MDHAVVYGPFPKEKVVNIRLNGDASEITTSEIKEVRNFFYFLPFELNTFSLYFVVL